MDTGTLKNIEYLPSQLHFEVDEKIDIKSLLPKLEVLFPAANALKIENSTLYGIEPSEAIKFIQITENKVIILYPVNSQPQRAPAPALNITKQLMTEIGVTELKNCIWQASAAHRFDTKKERVYAAKRLSPFPGFQARSIVIHPEKQTDYYIQISMAKRSQTEEGLVINFIYQITNSSVDAISSVVTRFEQDLYEHGTFTKAVGEILASLTPRNHDR